VAAWLHTASRMKTITAAFLLLSSLVHAQTAVLAPKSFNIEPGPAAAFHAVCHSAYQSVSGQPTMLSSDFDAAKAAGATEVIELSVIGLDGRTGKRLLVDGTRKTMDGKILYQEKIEALTLEDAPMACSRLATSLLNKEPIAASQTFKTVTEAEAAHRGRRLNSNVSLGVKMGFIAPLNSTTELSAMGSVLFNARFESQRWFAEVGAGIIIPSSSSIGAPGYGGLAVELGANYFLSDTDFAPYLGAGLQPRLVFSRSGLGLVPYAQFGAMTSRKHKVRFFADVRVGQNVVPVLTGFIGPATPIYPTELNVNVGLSF
jgi:hypothetical protein